MMMMTASPFYGHSMMNNKLPKYMYGGVDYPTVHDTVIVKQEARAAAAEQATRNQQQQQQQQQLSTLAPEMESAFINAPPLSTACSTPTSTRFLGINQPVTNEQESYAQGFFDALRQIRTRTEGPDQTTTPPPPPMSAPSPVMSQPGNVISSGLQQQPLQQHLQSPQMSSYGPNPSLGNVAHTYVTATTSVIPTHLERTLYQTPCDSGTSSPYSSHEDLQVASAYHHHMASPASMNCSPATSESDIYDKLQSGGVGVPHDMFRDAMAVVPDMKTQEQLKSDRKKARNRIAASKCRQKRLAREATLQDKVCVLRVQHNELQSERHNLKDSIAELKKQLSEHLQKGCQMDLPHIVNSNKKRSVS